jgi:hypothetical protein
MVACVSLMYDTHTPSAQGNGYHATACGLCIEDQYLPAGLFAEAADVTCEQCRRLTAAPGFGGRPHSDPKALVRRLIEGVLNDDVVDDSTPVVSGVLLERVTRARVQRLHRTFPNWTARIDELLTDDDSVFVRFDVDFADPFGVIGNSGAASKSGQAAVFRVTDNLISGVRPIVDDFGLWDESRPDWPSTRSRANPQTHHRMETAS